MSCMVCLRAVLVLNAIAATATLAVPCRAVEPIDGSFWVVGDAYFLGQPRRVDVGMTVVFWGGRLYWIKKDGSRIEKYELTAIQGSASFVCRCPDRQLVGRGVVTGLKGHDGVWIFLNLTDKKLENVAEVEPDMKKCDLAYKCLPISKNEAIRELTRFGITLE